MTEEKPARLPRNWWILGDCAYKAPCGNLSHEEVHVIEYSAYQAVLNKVEALDKLTELQHSNCERLKSENEKLERELSEANTQKQRWYDATQKTLDSKEELALEAKELRRELEDAITTIGQLQLQCSSIGQAGAWIALELHTDLLTKERDDLRRELEAARALLSNVTDNRDDWADKAGAYMHERDRLKQELLDAQREIVKRNQYKINEEYLANIHTHYEGLEAKLKTARELIDWLRDGIQHFQNDEDAGQREYLTEQIDKMLEEIDSK